MKQPPKKPKEALSNLQVPKEALPKLQVQKS